MTGVIVALILAAAAWWMFGRPQPAPPPAPAPKPTGPKRHWLVGQGGDVEGKTWHIGDRKVTVGRAPSNFVQVNVGEVSRQQCQLLAEDGVMVVVDMTSANGTRVNGEPVQRKKLADGDLLQVGDVRLLYRYEGDFEVNAAWQPKDAGAEVNKTTRGMTAEEARKLALAHQLWEHHGHDLGRAAAAMGVSEAEMQALLDQ